MEEKQKFLLKIVCMVHNVKLASCPEIVVGWGWKIACRNFCVSLSCTSSFMQERMDHRGWSNWEKTGLGCNAMAES